jgi:hypothetical protein
VDVARIELSEVEVRLLRELLQGDLARLLLEISHTDHREMREGLQRRESVLEGLLKKLRAGA